MKAAAVVCTYGRPALRELLACIARQTYQLPLLVYCDGLLMELENVPSEFFLVGEERRAGSLGLVRRSAVQAARTILQLESQDALLVLDDDDFYASQHFELTLRALDLAPPPFGWTGGLSMGLTVDGGAPELVRGEAGVGQHGTWAYRMLAYDAAGGYPDVHRDEDVALSHALGWRNCRPHHCVTHVRRHHRSNMSARDFDRDLVRKLDHGQAFCASPAPWSDELEQLEQWCQLRTLELATAATH
jgi:hypothetical protein